MSERVRLGDVISISSGRVDPREDPHKSLPHVGGDDIEADTGNLVNIHIAHDLNLIGGKYEFGPNDVLYSKIRPSLNKVALPAFSGICSTDIYPLRPHTHKLDRRYLAHILRHDDFVRYTEKHSSRTNIPEINRNALTAYEFPLPPLPEQRRIADILDKADAIRRKRKQAIALTEELLRSTFLEMFGDPVTNPKGWPMVPLSALGDVTTGNTPSRADIENFGDHIEWIKSDNINTPSHFLTQASEWLSEKGKECGRTAPSGSTLMTCIAGSPECIGNVALADREVAFNQQINAITPRKGVDQRYLYILLLLGKRLIQSASTNSMKGMVSKGRLEQVPLPAPPPSSFQPLQAAFGLAFDKIIKSAHQQQSAHIHGNALFASLVHRAFSGALTP